MEKRHFDEELRHLHEGIFNMGAAVEEIIHSAIDALEKRDSGLSGKVVESDRKIDEMEITLDEKCFRLIALYQPVAEDLRYISTAMNIINDLERIADIAVNIAEFSVELAREPLLKPLIDIPKMAKLAQDMIREVIAAFIQKDLPLAKKVWFMENESDKLRDLIQDELIGFIERDGTCAKRALPLLLVARYLERICDHCAHIAEDVIFIITGKIARHHPDIIDSLGQI